MFQIVLLYFSNSAFRNSFSCSLFNLELFYLNEGVMLLRLGISSFYMVISTEINFTDQIFFQTSILVCFLYFPQLFFFEMISDLFNWIV